MGTRLGRSTDCMDVRERRRAGPLMWHCLHRSTIEMRRRAARSVKRGSTCVFDPVRSAAPPALKRSKGSRMAIWLQISRLKAWVDGFLLLCASALFLGTDRCWHGHEATQAAYVCVLVRGRATALFWASGHTIQGGRRSTQQNLGRRIPAHTVPPNCSDRPRFNEPCAVARVANAQTCVCMRPPSGLVKSDQNCNRQKNKATAMTRALKRWLPSFRVQTSPSTGLVAKRHSPLILLPGAHTTPSPAAPKTSNPVASVFRFALVHPSNPSPCPFVRVSTPRKRTSYSILYSSSTRRSQPRGDFGTPT